MKSGVKVGDEGCGSLINQSGTPGGVAASWIVGVCASDISPCTVKSIRRFFWHRLTGLSRKKGRKRMFVQLMSIKRPVTAIHPRVAPGDSLRL